MRKYLLLAGAALIGLGGSAYAAIDCAVPPTCDELGYAYSSAECDGQSVLKCPFDQTKVFCSEPKDPNAPITCTVGSILYNDLKCYSKKPSGKTAIGVVFDHNKKLAISLDGGKNSIQWGGSGTDISTLTNCTSSNFSTCGTDGKDNTQKIVSALGTGSDYAAGYCYNKTDGGVAKGTWFLPSMSELKTLYNNKTQVNAGITAAGGTKFPTSRAWYWSSTEYNSTYVLGLNLDDGNVYIDLKTYSYSYLYARCAVAY